MLLVVDRLQLQVVGFKWADLDPNRLWFRISAPVRENFSTLRSEILNFHLDCMTLGAEKYEGDDTEIAKCHVRYWLDDIYAATKANVLIASCSSGPLLTAAFSKIDSSADPFHCQNSGFFRVDPTTAGQKVINHRRKRFCPLSVFTET